MGCEVVTSEICLVLSKARAPTMLLKVSVSLDYMAPLHSTIVFNCANGWPFDNSILQPGFGAAIFSLLCIYGLAQGLARQTKVKRDFL